jgi:hypothetical protein
MTTCPKCGLENPNSAQFCSHCHMTLQFTCPACKQTQTHGGTCDRCGVDFAKYALMLQFQMESELRQERERARSHRDAFRQAFLLPITGGLSLLKYLRSRMGSE